MDMRPRPISNRMRLNFKATNLTVTNETRAYLDKKLQSLEKLLDFDDEAVIVDVELGRTTRHHQSGDVFFAEINIHRGKESFRAVADRPDLMSAIDGMRDSMARELSAGKEKRLSLLRRSGQMAKAVLRGGYDGVQPVAPRAGAWIETRSDIRQAHGRNSRAPRGRVD